MNPAKSNIFSRIKNYRKLSQELEVHLSKNPDDWTKFQGVFKLTTDRLYQDIMEFERDNINKSEVEVYKLKRVFEKRYKRYFLFGEFIRWCLEKPYGYAGDFMIIDNIYQNNPRTKGFERLWDNWFMQFEASRAVRQRKDDFKKIIFDFVQQHKDSNLRIMNLASGPAREIKELLESDSQGIFSGITFDCYDMDNKALDYARGLLRNFKNVNFYQKNAIRLALKKEITEEVPYKYDIIYSTGLFDYLDEKISVRLVKNLNKLLRNNGIMVISNMGEKYSNPNVMWMEWVVDWYLIYRGEEEFKKIFLDAGIAENNLQIITQKDKIMQYSLAKKTD